MSRADIALTERDAALTEDETELMATRVQNPQKPKVPAGTRSDRRLQRMEKAAGEEGLRGEGIRNSNGIHGTASREKGISRAGGVGRAEDERGGGDEPQQSVMADGIMKAIAH